MEVFDQLVGADDLEHSTYRGMWQLNRCAPANLERCSIVEWNVERWAIASKWHLEEDRRGKPWAVPATIDDRAIHEIARLLKDKGVRDRL